MVGGAPRQRICVTGMHRTGTSLVAGLLNRHGLWLGDEADMMAANPYNPDGYFENVRLVAIDDAVLATFGGSWSSPPDFPDGWLEDRRLDPLKEAARELVETLGSAHEVWGFKDPRASLTLPFWRSVCGDLTVIVTVRNPLEAARSLHRRDGIALERGFDLWAAHYRSLLEHTTPSTRIVASYEAFCADPVRSAQALLSRLEGLREADPEAARASVHATLRHFRATPADLDTAKAPDALVELYSRLLAEAVQAEPAAEGGDVASLAGLDLAIRDVHVELQRLAAVVSRLENEIGFIRTADLAGIAAQLDYERVLVERIAQSLPPLGERVAATEAAIEQSVNGRHD